ncbi:fumarylacetoacetate hydrolase family protein [Agromyces bauzanensis]
MRIVRALHEGVPTYALVEGDLAYALCPSPTETELVQLTPTEIAGRADRTVSLGSYSELELCAPLVSPSKILCVGVNYLAHLEESGIDDGDVGLEAPVIFSKLPSAIVGPGDPIVWNPEFTKDVDWEGELAVVIGREMRDVPETDVADYIFGYTVANDISARDVQFSDGQWIRGKGMDTFCPLGPVVVLAHAFDHEEPHQIATRVNGQLMQSATIDRLRFGIDFLLSWLSRQITLLPGDILLTGTPEGVGAFRTPPVFLREGDRVEVEVEGIGALISPVGGSRK